MWMCQWHLGTEVALYTKGTEKSLYAAIAIYKRVSTITNSHGCVCSWDGLSCTAA